MKKAPMTVVSSCRCFSSFQSNGFLWCWNRQFAGSNREPQCELLVEIHVRPIGLYKERLQELHADTFLPEQICIAGQEIVLIGLQKIVPLIQKGFVAGIVRHTEPFCDANFGLAGTGTLLRL